MALIIFVFLDFIIEFNYSIEPYPISRILLFARELLGIRGARRSAYVVVGLCGFLCDEVELLIDGGNHYSTRILRGAELLL